jgi:hypothetical protein
MFIFELLIALLLVGAILSLWATRLGVPYPALLALTGAALALIPGMPEVALDPALALALFVAPTLLDAAYDASPRDLRDNLVSVASLALGAVGVTRGPGPANSTWGRGSGNSEAALISKDFLIGNTNATVNHTDGPFGDDMALTDSAIR